jgi:hypothetical protein
LYLVSAKRQWGSAAFLIFWLTGWTFGCIMLAGLVITQLSFFILLFAIPFWAAELFVFSLVGSMIASREQVVLDADGLAYRWTIWRLPVSRRRIPLSEIVGIEDELAPPAPDNNQAFAKVGHRLTLQTIGQPLELPGGASREEQRWLAHLFAETLAALKRYHAPIERVAGNEPAMLPSPDELPEVLELRPPASTVVPQPSDTTWQYAYDIDAITFRERGQLSLGGLGFLLFINAFWNGVTGMFAAGLWGFLPDGQDLAKRGADWWFLFFFLIPFQLIGLMMFAALVFVLSEPLRRSRWTLARNTVSYRLSYLGIGKTWTYEIRELDRLELRKRWITKEGDGETKNKKKDKVTGADLLFHLALVDRDGKDVCQIEDLSLGEGCWMADVILRERSGWFRPGTN